MVGWRDGRLEADSVSARNTSAYGHLSDITSWIVQLKKKSPCSQNYANSSERKLKLRNPLVV